VSPGGTQFYAACKERKWARERGIQSLQTKDMVIARWIDDKLVLVRHQKALTLEEIPLFSMFLKPHFYAPTCLLVKQEKNDFLQFHLTACQRTGRVFCTPKRPAAPLPRYMHAACVHSSKLKRRVLRGHFLRAMMYCVGPRELLEYTMRDLIEELGRFGYSREVCLSSTRDIFYMLLRLPLPVAWWVHT